MDDALKQFNIEDDLGKDYLKVSKCKNPSKMLNCKMTECNLLGESQDPNLNNQNCIGIQTLFLNNK